MSTEFDPIQHHPDAEAQGRYLQHFLQSTEDVLPALRRRTQDVLAAKGIEDVDREAYYPIEDVAGVFQNIAASMGERTLSRGAEKMGLDLPVPASVDSPHAALERLDDRHRESCRISPDADESGPAATDPAGGYDVTFVDPATARVAITDRYPFPDVMAGGIVRGAVNRLTDANTSVRTERVPTDHGERAAWEITWA
ncbi:hypothetical protein [Halococcoides cellulosivorans]|nr:hypothetical protein [Halococcoides cellulosivorans]